MQIHTRIESLRAALASATRIAFAPTMGNLHAGHLSLMQTARTHGDAVVSSIFVNRTQFGPNEDFDRYPRTFQADCEQLAAVGVDHLFAPDEAELYPQAQSYFVQPAARHDEILEGASRPGHFRGVATIVTKLFNIVQPQIALFGKKDYQQLIVIRNMVRELNLPITIIGCDTVRAPDGLALSSRNGYLTAEQRVEAPRLAACLKQLAAAVKAGRQDYTVLEAEAVEQLRAHGWQPDYIAIRQQSDLQAPQDNQPLVVVAAARLGSTRLIDNLEIN
ncbi:pantoate--beta-alanine ligase [Uliginosibacterium sp. 31-12]|uniref:pantoate--beta-alanine ligase n=1 Tax=Uliginosibacterium sp. 31-12 TaxID=3062781 RepID=UPI0026E23A03|nr:pantoate--beta-alanine ligase [Uliginosibacterium sp. 31-12]MDO6384857.1 pantoate--beta-alanine ligase [Uliginosibacterium sp. 31-12]